MILHLVNEVAALADSGAGRTIWRAVVWRIVTSALGAAPYAVLYLTLVALLDGRLDAAALAWATGALAVLLLLEMLCARMADLAAFLGGYAMFADLRRTLARHLARLPLGWFARRPTGELAGTLAENLQMAEELLTHLVSMIVGGIAVPAFIAVVLAVVDWRLALIALASAPLAVLVMAGTRAGFARVSRARIAEAGEASARLLDYVQGLKVLRVFGLTGDRFVLLDRSLRRLMTLSIRVEMSGGAALVGFVLMLESGFLAMLVAGSAMVLDGTLATPSFLLFLVLAQRFYGPLAEVAGMLAQSAYIDRCLARVRALMAEAPLAVPATPRLPQGLDIALADVSFTYPGEARPAVSSVSALIPAGALVALVGPSGAGKSTLAQLIARFDDVTGGAIRIGGVDLRDLDPRWLQGAVAPVFQDVYLFRDTVAANLLIARPEATRDDLVAACRAACIHDTVMALPQGYDTVIGERGASLSGGERQRLSIARALLKDAPIVLLDEATAAVDPENEALLQQAFAALARGRTVIVIAHRLSSVINADLVVVMDRGRVVAQGRHAQLIAEAGLYAEMFSAQAAAADFRF
jgi:ATP-binding cassette subfamily B protein